jgi:hypothetical protein
MRDASICLEIIGWEVLSMAWHEPRKYGVEYPAH